MFDALQIIQRVPVHGVEYTPNCTTISYVGNKKMKYWPDKQMIRLIDGDTTTITQVTLNKNIPNERMMQFLLEFGNRQLTLTHKLDLRLDVLQEDCVSADDMRNFGTWEHTDDTLVATKGKKVLEITGPVDDQFILKIINPKSIE